MNGSDGFVGVVVLVFGLALYFLPAIVAAMRDHPQAFPVALLNFFLGWTLLGWVVALVWAFINPSRRPIPAAVEATKTCPKCAESVKRAALVCRFCGHEFETAAAPIGLPAAGRHGLTFEPHPPPSARPTKQYEPTPGPRVPRSFRASDL